jgi:hypothetical protein
VQGVVKHGYFVDKNVNGPLFIDNRKFQTLEQMIQEGCQPVANHWHECGVNK